MIPPTALANHDFSGNLGNLRFHDEACERTITSEERQRSDKLAPLLKRSTRRFPAGIRPSRTSSTLVSFVNKAQTGAGGFGELLNNCR